MFDVEGSESDGDSESGINEIIQKGFTVSKPIVDE